MRLIWLLGFAILVSSGVFASDDEGAEGVVEVKQGKIEGVKRVSRSGNEYYAFLGVPYGKAPERFGLAQEADSWTGVKKVIKHAPHCAQFCLMQQRILGVEDCLTLNIYARKDKLDGKVPVMVMFHGGGFQFGSGSFTEGKYFMDEDVILVTVQYRLGILGFLNTEDDTVHANLGLKDQSTSLKWIQENIASFGGDPNKVTIFGYSAGGASTHYQMLSPMSKGLFSSAISQSGSAFNPWAFQSRPKELAERLSKSIGCSIDTTEKMVECLKGKPPAELITAQLKLSKFPHEFDFISMLFSPSVERGTLEPKFISDTPYALVVNGKTASKVPWIVGVTAEEGAFYTANIIESQKSLDILNSDWFKMLPNILYYENSASPATQSRISSKVKDFYFPDDKKITKEDYLQLGQVFGDRFFVVGISRAIKEHAKKAEFPVYPYIFNYTGSHSIVEGMLGASRAYGVAHADDLKYLFNKTYISPEYGLETDEGKFSQKLLKLYLSFARDGKPTETWGSAKSWEPFQQDEIEDEEKAQPVPWYVIDEDTKILEEDVFKARTDFWESLPLREVGKEDLPEEKDEL